MRDFLGHHLHPMDTAISAIYTGDNVVLKEVVVLRPHELYTEDNPLIVVREMDDFSKLRVVRSDNLIQKMKVEELIKRLGWKARTNDELIALATVLDTKKEIEAEDEERKVKFRARCYLDDVPKPLPWSELTRMLYHPVWIYDGAYGEWNLIREVTRDSIVVTDIDGDYVEYKKDSYPESWCAYAESMLVY